MNEKYEMHVENGTINENDLKSENPEQSGTDESTKTIDIKMMDDAVKKVRELRDDYKAKKKASDDAHSMLKSSEAALISLMQRAEKKTYIVTGVGRVTISEELSIQTPKTREEKLAFFKWLAEHKGQEVADNYMTINSQSLNSLYGELTEEAAQKGEVLMVDGLGEPIVRTTLSLRQA